MKIFKRFEEEKFSPSLYTLFENQNSTFVSKRRKKKKRIFRKTTLYLHRDKLVLFFSLSLSFCLNIYIYIISEYKYFEYNLKKEKGERRKKTIQFFHLRVT